VYVHAVITGRRRGRENEGIRGAGVCRVYLIEHAGVVDAEQTALRRWARRGERREKGTSGKGERGGGEGRGGEGGDAGEG